ncbi:acyloxyacyl hydrolase [Arenibacterium sp. LLYu02]|uniref:acyloxyacyl hydrolase n=1 Tax=Arenibacterium sp. LLYu02 TaxID=3404132 RepID=UPI003B21C384
MADQLIFGAGFANYSHEAAENSAVFAVEYQGKPFLQRPRLEARWAVAAELQAKGDAFVGGGISGRWALPKSWFVEASVMPGLYLNGPQGNDLGSTFEIRSLLGLGRELKNGTALSLAIAHKSNASTGRINPGVNSLILRWHCPLGSR